MQLVVIINSNLGGMKSLASIRIVSFVDLFVLGVDFHYYFGDEGGKLFVVVVVTVDSDLF